MKKELESKVECSFVKTEVQGLLLHDCRFGLVADQVAVVALFVAVLASVSEVLCATATKARMKWLLKRIW